MKDLTDLNSYQFLLPQELVAQYPKEPRDHCRLLVVDRASESFSEIPFYELRDFLKPADSLVFNDVKVIPARIMASRQTGGKAECLLLERKKMKEWSALLKPGKKCPPGTQLKVSDEFYIEILQDLEDGEKKVLLQSDLSEDLLLEKYGSMPLPPYIRGGIAEEKDKKDYQTVYAEKGQAAAAPTAGLHFTERLLNDLKAKGIEETMITLNVGLGTFRPVQVQNIKEHKMHSEKVVISEEAARSLNRRNPQGRQVCVGTTTVRALESCVNEQGKIVPGTFDTNIFIYPPYQFKYVQALLTNFHLPGSTLLMMVSAFAGYELIMAAYEKAVKDKFRFFSYGDAMLIV